MFSRRGFLYLAAAAARGAAPLTGKQRVDRVLKGQDVDRTPFSFWHHFGLEKLPAERHAQATLDFHHRFHTDLVKVMSDYPFPKPAGDWNELKVVNNPFPEQLHALELINEGLGGEAYFLETIFNPWNVAEKLSSPAEVLRLKQENPKALQAALEAIAESEASHARKAVAAGAAGIFLAIANAQDGIMTPEEYVKFSEPFDRLILDAVNEAPLNVLHLHGDKVYLDHFVKGWPAAAINYSNAGTGKSVAAMRASYTGVLMAGLDEVNFRKLSEADLQKQWDAAREAAGRKFILTPGCSVPNESTDEELMRLVRLVTAKDQASTLNRHGGVA
jgi:uroporphyrinogen decarboxylase